jgi:hypothetical protein
MRYLVLLLLLIGCSGSPKYEVGDCVQIVHKAGVVVLKVKGVTDNYYIFTPVYNNDKKIIEVGQRFTFDILQLERYTDNKKIECSEVE